jgi:hypothetical protein
MAVIQFPNVLLSPPGDFNAALIDNNGNPSTVLDAGQVIRINADWTISPLAALLLGGRFEVAAYVEAIGPGPEQQIGPTSTVLLNGSTSYSTTIVVPPSTLPNPPPAGQSGAYKVVVLLTHRNFGAVSDVSAIVEFPVVRIG